MSRLTLPNGDWADFDTRLTYAQARRIREASGTLDQEATFVCALVRAWALRGTNDEPIAFPERDAAGIPLGALDAVPFDTFQAMTIHAANEIEGVPDPKGTSGTSTGSKPEARPSASRRTSQRPTSSSSIQDGATPTFKPPLPM